MRPAVYANHKRKDGTYPLKIVVYFKGKERKLATHIICDKQDLTRELKIKQGDALYQARELMEKMRNSIKDLSLYDLEYRDVDFVVNTIKARLAKESFRLDFFQFADGWMKDKKPATRAGYSQAVNAFARFLGKREQDINGISGGMVRDFMEFVNNEPLMYWEKSSGKLIATDKNKTAKGQAPRHARKLGKIFAEAKRKYNDEDIEMILIPRSPFANLDLSTAPSEGQKPLPLEVMQMLISARVDSEVVQSCIDVAVVSFGLMGANLADLYEAEKPSGKRWVYNRKKTRDRRQDKAEMKIDIPSCLEPYIGRLMGESGWLGRLRKMASSPEHVTSHVNAGLRKWCEQEGIEPFTFYAIRKTWATLARREGVEKALVDECLAHVGDYDLTDIYAERPWHLINEANAKVLQLFKWD